MTVPTPPPLRALLFAWGGVALFGLSLLYFLYSYAVRFGRPAPAAALLPAVATDVALFSVFALHHSVFARTRVKSRIIAVVPPAMERVVYVWVASALFVLVCVLWRPVPGELYALGGAGAWVGYALQLTGVVLTARSSARLDFLDLAGVRPLLQARGAHAPAEMPLETRGPYGFVRHPLYFAWALMVFGAPHMTLTRLVFACTSTAYLAIAIPFEERALVERFGRQYREYQMRVRWRMFPGVY